MKNLTSRKWRGLLAPIALGLALYTPPVKALESNRIDWAKSISDVTTQAKASEKLIFVYFFAFLSEECSQFEDETLQDSKVAVLLGEFEPFRVNAERGQGPELATYYNVASWPHTFILGTDGEKISEVAGYKPGPDFAQELTQILKTHSEERLLKQAAANRDDPWAATSLAVMYGILGDFENTQKYIKRANASDETTPAGKKNARRLMLANLLLGDVQMRDGFPEWALPYYVKAEQLAATPSDKVSTRLEVANCYILVKEPEKAIPLLQAVLATPDIAPAEKTLAEELLKKAKPF